MIKIRINVKIFAIDSHLILSKKNRQKRLKQYLIPALLERRDYRKKIEEY